MAVKMRLRREGKRKQPFYRIVVTPSRKPRDGGFIEDLGYYQPLWEPSSIKIDRERALYWLREGVQPSDQVKQILRVEGIWEEFKPGDPGRDRSEQHAAEAARAAERQRAAEAEQQQVERKRAEAEAAEAEGEGGQEPAPDEADVAQAVEEVTQPRPGPTEETGALAEEEQVEGAAGGQEAAGETRDTAGGQDAGEAEDAEDENRS